MSKSNKSVIFSQLISGVQRDTGSLHLGGALPARLQFMGRPQEKLGTKLFIQLEGEAQPREVTWVMGSAKKGFSVCTKGAGPFPTGESVSVKVELLVDGE